MAKPALLILAAGLGSRYKAQKQIDAITENGETLMEFALFDAIANGIRKFVFIVNNQFPVLYKKHLSNILSAQDCEVHFVEQSLSKFVPELYLKQLANRKKPLGTAHAVYCAKEIIHEPFITMNADDFYGRGTFETACNFLKNHPISDTNFAMIAFNLKNTLSENGTVSRGICNVKNHHLIQVEEYISIEKNGDQICGINSEKQQKILDESAPTSMNFWILHPAFFDAAENGLKTFLENTGDLTTAEFYLPSLIDSCIKEQKLQVQVLKTAEKWFGMTHPNDKEIVVEKIKTLRKAGIYPQKLWH